MKNSELRIIVGGMVAQYPVGGVAWDYLQYVIGLAQLGHDVYYHEDAWSWPYDPIRNTASSDGTYSAQFLDGFFRQYAPGLSEHWCYDHLREHCFGMSSGAFAEVAATADLFINVSGASTIPRNLAPRCVKLFLDTDPGYNQIMLVERHSWSENVDRWCGEVNSHDRHFTYAENLGADDCLVPSAGYSWSTTRMPVVLELWSDLMPTATSTEMPWTTVVTWNNFKGPLTHQGIEYKGKGAEFEKIMELPQTVSGAFRIAVGGTEAPESRLRDSGWHVVPGPEATLTPERYREFICGSRGEISTAKHVYVAMRTGWFSCRSACYMAAGRPVVLQDTAFSRILPVGEGLLAFESTEEAVQCIDLVENDYERHATTVREISREYFAADKVLGELVERAMS